MTSVPPLLRLPAGLTTTLAPLLLAVTSLATAALGQGNPPDLSQLRAEIERIRADEFGPGSRPATTRRVTTRSGLVATTAASVKTVKVDCNKNQTIQKALETKADELIIEIEGLCVEDVEIHRARVTLLGQDPAVDGIRATAGSDDPRQSALHIRNARRVRLENLRFEGSSWNGVRVTNSFDGIDFVNVVLTDNTVRGLTLIDSTATMIDSSITGNGDPVVGSGSGAYSFGSSIFVCERCTILDNPSATQGTALIVDQGEATVRESTVGGRTGIRTVGSAQASLRDSSVDAVTALFATESSNLVVANSATQGQLLAAGTSHLELFDSIHTGTDPSFAFDDAYVWTNGSIDGTMTLLDFARARLVNGADLGGVACIDAAQAVCSFGAAVGFSSCGGCAAP